jgi:diguanylate cyclase (GGDEF)-like protein
MAHTQHAPVLVAPEQFIVDVGAELTSDTLQKRAKAVNALLRLAMLAGLEMELDAAVNTFADCMAEIVPYERILAFFWDEERELPGLRLARGLEGIDPEVYAQGNIFNLWASRFAKPMLISAGEQEDADSNLLALQSGSALVIPINVGSRVMGSVQLYSRKPHRFGPEDAQLLWIFSLIAENQLSRGCAHEGLLRFAFTDYLTGLRTRGYFEQQLDLEIKRAERKGSFLSILMVDIDRFKLLNDQWGHHVGDQVLREVASLLERDTRDLDTLARYGGEEFVIILPETDAEGAFLVAQRMRQSIEQARFSPNTLCPIEPITISLGIAVHGKDTWFKRELIEFADAALYRAKHRGRNQVVMYSEPTADLETHQELA